MSCYRIAQLKPGAVGRYRFVYGEAIDRRDLVIVHNTCYASSASAKRYAEKHALVLKKYKDQPLLIVQDYGDLIVIRHVVQ